MKNKCKEADSPVAGLKNESSRQRWELFHRAIAHAKQSNIESEIEPDTGTDETGDSPAPLLTIVR